MSHGREAVDVAGNYVARGWSPIPVPYRQKGPVIDRWQNLRIEAEDVPRYFKGRSNVGVLTGEPSGGLIDIDLDHPLAVELAPQFLPATSCIFGRAGKPRSHYLYVSPGAATHKRSTGQAAGMIVELRSTGCQTVFPGSVHESGELIEWAEDGEPARIDPGLLQVHVDELADEVERRLGLRAGDGFDDDEKLPDTSGWRTDEADQAKGLKPGEDFNRRGDVREVLRRHGWAFIRKELPDIERWRRPGKDRGVSGSLLNGKVFFCFTSSTAIPDSMSEKKGHSPFAVLTYLEYGGDFSKCAKALAQQGYGEKSKAATPVLLQQPFRPFPVDALPPLCAKFVRQAAESIDCDESMVALPLIGDISAAIGNSCRIQLKDDYSEPAVVWAAIVCESGTRKSAALEAPLKAIRRRELVERRKHNELLSRYTTELAQFKAAYNEWQRKGHKEGEPPPTEPEKPVCRRFTVSDVTAEGLAMRLEQNSRGLLLIRDELAGFFTGLNQYKANGKGADEAAFLAMHGARPLVIDRKNPDKPSIYIWMANVSIIGTIQPAILRRLWTRERMEAGMGARFLIAYPPPRAVRWREKSVDKHVEDRIATMFDFLLGIPMQTDEETNEPTPEMLPLTPEAKQLWIPFHNAHCDEQIELEGDLSAAWAKLTGYAARLALVVELASWATGDEWDRPKSISAASMRSGIVLAQWFAEETKRVYAILSETDEQKELRWLLDYIRQRGGVITARDLSRGPRRYRDCVDLADARLDQLVRSGLGHWEHIPTSDQGGRPTRQFRLKQTCRGDETPANAEESGGSVAVASDDVRENEEGEWTG